MIACAPVKLQPESRAEKTLPTALQGAGHALQHALGRPPHGHKATQSQSCVSCRPFSSRKSLKVASFLHGAIFSFALRLLAFISQPDLLLLKVLGEIKRKDSSAAD